MSYSRVYSAQTNLLSAYVVDVESDLARGLHSFSIVGLPDKAVEESKDRISAAIKNSGFESPKSLNKKITISLAPADIRKEGAGLDLAMAVSYLLTAGEITFDPQNKIFIGELSLDGKLRPVKGVLALVREAKRQGFSDFFLPEENAYEAAIIDGVSVYGLNSLLECINILVGAEKARPRPKTEAVGKNREIEIDLADIKGQEGAKRALEIAAAGGHNIALYGPPGTGKTMLAKAFRSLLPPLSFEEMLEITEIHSIAGSLKNSLVTERPFRSPHHTSSYIAIVGGGNTPKPGEITLSHRGVLFLDEFPEFDAKTVEALRQPLEDKVVTVSRAKGSARFPANFILIAAMNPCPCGNFGIKGKPCSCGPRELLRYKRKLSGPIIDRIDIWVEVSKVDYDKLSANPPAGGGESESLPAIVRILKARKKQEVRFGGAKTNGEMSAKEIVSNIFLAEKVKDILNESAKRFDISARGYHKIIKLARTIADLENAENIESNHILEAISYRPKVSY